MEGDRKMEWKATCGYSFQDGKSTSEDVVRSAFQTLDLFNFRTNGTSQFSAECGPTGRSFLTIIPEISGCS